VPAFSSPNPGNHGIDSHEVGRHGNTIEKIEFLTDRQGGQESSNREENIGTNPDCSHLQPAAADQLGRDVARRRNTMVRHDPAVIINQFETAMEASSIGMTCRNCREMRQCPWRQPIIIVKKMQVTAACNRRTAIPRDAKSPSLSVYQPDLGGPLPRGPGQGAPRVVHNHHLDLVKFVLLVIKHALDGISQSCATNRGDDHRAEIPVHRFTDSLFSPAGYSPGAIAAGALRMILSMTKLIIPQNCELRAEYPCAVLQTILFDN
jgi:hypothetical protein